MPIKELQSLRLYITCLKNQFFINIAFCFFFISDLNIRVAILIYLHLVPELLLCSNCCALRLLVSNLQQWTDWSSHNFRSSAERTLISGASRWRTCSAFRSCPRSSRVGVLNQQTKQHLQLSQAHKDSLRENRKKNKKELFFSLPSCRWSRLWTNFESHSS